MTPSVEHGLAPSSQPLWRRALGVARHFTTPHTPDDYLELLDPRWAMTELTGTVIRTIQETPTARTLVLRPSAPWPGHRPGQYVRLGVEIDGIRHWRAYSVTSDPMHPAGEVSITVQRIDGGRVSSYLTQRCAPGDRLYLGAVEGHFCLPDDLPSKVLMITGGCGITPAMSMLRELERRGRLDDVVHLHASRDADSFIFGPMLRALSTGYDGYQLHEIHTRETGRLHRQHLDRLVPDWWQRTTFLSGPVEMMDDFRRHWDEHGDPALLHGERFQPTIGLGDEAIGEGGTVALRVSGVHAACAPGVSILVGGERAGAQLPHGCRMGICHSCIGRLQSGQVRDLRTGEVHGEAGQLVRTCVNAPVGDVEIEL